jgi:hypothetical protein
MEECGMRIFYNVASALPHRGEEVQECLDHIALDMGAVVDDRVDRSADSPQDLSEEVRIGLPSDEDFVSDSCSLHRGAGRV